jgi:hypothetical protein
MKRIGLTALAIALLACASASAFTALSGTFTGTVSKHGTFNGKWSLAFKGSGYTIARNGKTLVVGKFTQRGSAITFADRSGAAACKDKGTYKYTLNGHTLTFKLVRDAKCPGRRVVLGVPFSRKLFSNTGAGY